MTRPEVLFLAHRIPYPPDKGDKIRSWRIFEHLTKRFDVHLAAFVDDPADFAHEQFLREKSASLSLIPLSNVQAAMRSATGFVTGEPLSLPYYRSAPMARAVDALREKDLAAEIVFSSSMAQYVTTPVNARLRIIDLCDADSEKWRQYAVQKRFPMSAVYNREAERLQAIEADIIASFDASFAISKAEAAVLARGTDDHSRLRWFGNGVDTEYFAPGAGGAADRAADVVFTGAMDYWANIDAALWFIDSVWPAVRRVHAKATFAIVGRNPASALRAYHDRDGISVTGEVADVRPWISSAKIAVAPMRIARGVQNKVLEAMACGRPVVATTHAAEGIDIRDGDHYLKADEAEAFADGVNALLANKDRRDALASAGRGRMLLHYQWTHQLERFDEALGALGL